MENGLVLNATQYGIEKSKANQLEKVFVPMVEKFKELENEYNEVLSNKEITKQVCHDAKTVRNKYVKVRTGADEIHKIAKASLLVQTRAIDGLRNIVKYAVIDHENSLLEVEKHFEKIEAERLDKIRIERNTILEKYDINPGVGDIAIMSDDVWKHYIKSVKVDFDAKIEAEKKAESERIAKEKAEIAEQKRIKLENEKLKKEAESKRIEDEKAEKERQRLAKIEFDKRAKEEKYRIAKQEKERKEYEERLRDEREARKKSERELKAKQENERKEKEFELSRIEKEKEEKRKLELAPEKIRLTKWVNDMAIIDILSQNMSKESAIIAGDIIDKFDSFKNWAKSEINKIH